MASPPEAEAARGSLLRRVVRYPFLPGMAAAFADYLGMALITPALPYFLEEELGMSTRDSSLWTGAITTAQYAGGAVGNTFVGVLGDRLGSRFTLASTLGGDVVFFAATAFARSVALILSGAFFVYTGPLRFLAGVASPLVPSLMYILERATEEGASKLAGVNAYSASVNFAYAFAGMIVGLFYSELGWTGLNLFSAAVAALALVVVWELAAENNDNGRGDGVGVILGDGEEKQERGGDAEVVSAAAVSAAAAAAEPLGGPPPNPNPNQNPNQNRSPEGPGRDDPDAGVALIVTTLTLRELLNDGGMASHMYTAFNTGYLFMGFLVLYVLMAKEILGWTVVQVGWSFIAIPAANVLTMYALLPAIIRNVGVHGCLTYASFATCAVLTLFAVPAVHSTAVGFMFCVFALIVCIVCAQTPNQMRIKTISDSLSPAQMGQITGISRVCFALGQMVSPIACAALFTASPSAAIASMIATTAGVPAMFLRHSQGMFRDPPPAVRRNLSRVRLVGEDGEGGGAGGGEEGASART